MKIKDRHIMGPLNLALSDTPVVVLEGPRQSGKTTLVQQLAQQLNYHYISFDDKGVLKNALADPMGFVRALPLHVVLDEAQKVASLFSAFKLMIDENRQPGRFLMTGSMSVLRLKQTSDSLAGRAAYLRLHPLSQAELEDHNPSFIDRLFKGDFKIQQFKAPSGKRLEERITAGGYPPAVMRSQLSRFDWHRNYINTLVHHDLPSLTRIRALDTLPLLLHLAASRTAQLLNTNRLASDFKMSRNTVCEYLNLLETAFLIYKLPAWYQLTKPNRRVVKSDKLHMGDTGLAASMLNLNSKALREAGPIYGQLLESFVLQELLRLSQKDQRYTYDFSHYRDKDNAEVDIVITKGRTDTVGLEVKAASTVHPSDFKGLKKLQHLVGEKNFKTGLVLYTGDRILPFGKNFYCLPLQCLWTF